MDSSETKNKYNRYNTKAFANVGNVLQSLRIRCAFLFSTTANQFLSDYNFTFLPSISTLLWIVLLFTTIL